MPKLLCCLVSLNAQSGDTLLVFKSQETLSRANTDMGHHFCLEIFKQMMMFRMILDKPGIYLSEIQDKLMHIFGVNVCVSTIYRTLKIMGCTRQAMHRVALQRSNEQQARFMAEISI